MIFALGINQPRCVLAAGLSTACILLWSDVSAAQHPTPANADAVRAAAKNYSVAGPVLPRQLLWGDTHLHTRFSFDAGMVGNELDPEQAYQFARGDTVTASVGIPARLHQPLDFLAVSDHAESLGLAPAIAESNPLVLEDENASRMRELIAEGKPIEAYKLFARLRAGGEYVLHRDDLIMSMWQRMTAAADRFYQPGQFTTFIAYEYTSAVKMNNLHRVVLLRDGADKANKLKPFSTADSPNPEHLWDWMSHYETVVGGNVLAIPHNGNLSNGLMFALEDFSGEPFSAELAAERARWEPLYEVTQIKGDGEAHLALSPDDEFADFWTWDRGNFGLTPKTPDMLPGEYGRSGLKRGLSIESKLGVNPFKFGLVGATDSHTGLPTIEENNFFSKASPAEPGVGNFRYTGDIIQKYPGAPDVSVQSYESAAGGVMAVWATENTREAIFDAMRRKEVYATTGPRMGLRVFASYDFAANAHQIPDIAELGYAYGVPMGADLSVDAQGRAPSFLIAASRDPRGANLDRVQVVKGWMDSEGQLHERVFDVAWSGDRALNQQGKVPAVGSTVNGASYDNSIGSPMLAVTWQDPTFDPSQRAFWYVRVLEIPTPTWLAYDKAHFGELAKIPEDALWEHQERAYSSPIWYSP